MAAEYGRHTELLEQFLAENVRSRLEMGILSFWSRHPATKFSQPAITYAMDSNKLDMQQALDALVSKGLLQRHTANGVALYSLTADDERRSLVLELGGRASEMQDNSLHHLSGLVAGNAAHRS